MMLRGRIALVTKEKMVLLLMAEVVQAFSLQVIATKMVAPLSWERGSVTRSGESQTRGPREPRGPYFLNSTGMMRMARMFTTLIIGFTAGPEVSL